jgi:hypothetical protein
MKEGFQLQHPYQFYMSLFGDGGREADQFSDALEKTSLTIDRELFPGPSDS